MLQLCILLKSSAFRLSGWKQSRINFLQIFGFCSHTSFATKMKGIVLGVYTEASENGSKVVSFTDSFKEVNEKYGGQLEKLLKATGPFIDTKQRLLWTPLLGKEENEYDCVSVVNLGDRDCKDNPLECRNEKNENSRCATALGIKLLRAANHFDDIFLDPIDAPQCVAEAAYLVVHKYDELKSKSKSPPKLHLYKSDQTSSETVDGYEKGVTIAECQNFARVLAEAPANHMTPTIFTQKVADMYKDFAKVLIRDTEWIEQMKMGAFLSVSRGSDEPPKFLEIHYDGNTDSQDHIAFIGKGITFDSGGISLKPHLNMDLMRCDMGGAASVVGAVLAVSKLKLKINVKVFIPLSENMINGKATKPGDVVYAMNGKSIQVDNTDAEGRLVLADALCYAQQFKPKLIIDVATLTGAAHIVLDTAASCVYSNTDEYWNILNKAGYETGDRVWRLPLFGHYAKGVTSAPLADINNCEKACKAGSCVAAAFLKEFIQPNTPWIHIDMSCVKSCLVDEPYMCKGMSGRPARTLVKFLEYLCEK